MFLYLINTVGLLVFSIQVRSLPFPIDFSGTTTPKVPDTPPGLPELKNVLGNPLTFSFTDQKAYLNKYGYMGKTSPNDKMRELSVTNPDKAFRKAMGNFQKFAGLAVTGKVNQKTKKKMLWPRCGLPDNFPSPVVQGGRKKRFTVHDAGGWNRTNLSYKITNTPKIPFILGFGNGSRFGSAPKAKEVKAAIRKAFNAWSSISVLRFTEVKRKPDIKLRFVKRRHGDGIPFDGPNLAIAHAFYPIHGGDTHFDNTEVWGVDDTGKYGYDIFQVTVHELGHAFGLGHTSKRGAVMYSFYRFRKNFKFHNDDKFGIRYLYPKKQF